MNIFTRIVLGFLTRVLCGGKVEHLDICVMLRLLAGRISRGCLILKVFVMSALCGHWSRPLWPRRLGDTPLWLVINSWTSAQGWHAGMLTCTGAATQEQRKAYPSSWILWILFTIAIVLLMFNFNRERFKT